MIKTASMSAKEVRLCSFEVAFHRLMKMGM